MEAKRQKEANDRYIMKLHHVLCTNYGWIPFNEFLELPIPTVINLYSEIYEESENQRKQIEASKKK